MSHSAIIGFGRYIPRFRLKAERIAEQWEQDAKTIVSALGVTEKSVPGKDEDSFTMAFEAGKQAIETAEIQSSEISAIFVGSESHPYAVKPTSSMIASALELHPFSHCADLEFACKAGTAGMQIVDSMVRSGQIEYGMAIGTDTAQSRPGDALEYTAAAGAAAIILGPADAKNALCRIDATLSFTTDTPDFWRASDETYPRHAGRFTGEPGYFRHVKEAVRGILEPTTATESKKNSKKIILIVVAILLVLAIAGGIAYQTMSNSTTPSTEVINTKNQNPTPEEKSMSSYKNGEFQTIGNYTSPGGPEEIDVIITLTDGVISDAEVISKATRDMSKKMQADFIANYKPLVIGRKIDEVSLTKVSGSSLTPKGFNEALEEIKIQAKS
jgi:3-oxoacyl-[acyl-carrier-protein] synthase III